MFSLLITSLSKEIAAYSRRADLGGDNCGHTEQREGSLLKKLYSLWPMEQKRLSHQISYTLVKNSGWRDKWRSNEEEVGADWREKGSCSCQANWVPPSGYEAVQQEGQENGIQSQRISPEACADEKDRRLCHALGSFSPSLFIGFETLLKEETFGRKESFPLVGELPLLMKFFIPN